MSQTKPRTEISGPIIVGAGPSGLAVSACLVSNNIPSLVLERSDCIASLWQYRTYDRLSLHLPKQFCELPLLGFPAGYPKYPSKAQFVTYMENYARHFGIRPVFGQEVERAEREPGGGWVVYTRDRAYVSRWLVVATGENAEPVLADNIAGIEGFGGDVLHTSVYKSGSVFEKKRVLVVGCGNSGMEVSLDLCRHNAYPYVVVRNSVHILPREMFGFSTFGVAMALLKYLPLKLVDKFLLLMANLILGNTDKLGLRRPKTGPLELKNATGKTPVLDVGALAQIKAGKIKVVEGVKEITTKGAKFIDGQEKEFDSIILATGYKSIVPSWLKGCDFFAENGLPKTSFPNCWKGENGLYTVGFTRGGILGTVSDSLNIAKDITQQWGEPT